MNLDLIASVLCAVFASSLFALSFFSRPSYPYARTLPNYVRTGAVVTAVTAAWRAFDFLNLATSSHPIGHINAVGVMVLIPLVYFLTALAYWICGEPLSKAAWERMEHAYRESAKGSIPVMLSPHEVADANRALGTPTIEAGEGPEAVQRERDRALQ